MNDKTINGIQVSDDIFNRMIMLQERLRRIEAESRLLSIEKSETEASVKVLVELIEKSKLADTNGHAQQAVVVSSTGHSPTA